MFPHEAPARCGRVRAASNWVWGVVAMGMGLSMMVIDWPPDPSHPTQSARDYILNVFVEPEQRGRCLDHMALHVIPMGRPFYETPGWSQTSEVGLSLQDRGVGGDGSARKDRPDGLTRRRGSLTVGKG